MKIKENDICFSFAANLQVSNCGSAVSSFFDHFSPCYQDEGIKKISLQTQTQYGFFVYNDLCPLALLRIELERSVFFKEACRRTFEHFRSVQDKGGFLCLLLTSLAGLFSMNGKQMPFISEESIERTFEYFKRDTASFIRNVNADMLSLNTDWWNFILMIKSSAGMSETAFNMMLFELRLFLDAAEPLELNDEDFAKLFGLPFEI